MCVTDADFGISGSGLLVGGMEAPCDELRWLDRPEDARATVSPTTWETQSYRLARRIPAARVLLKPAGIVGVYDVTHDWIPIYDRTKLAGYYVAIGASGHGFKQAPFVGALMTALITAWEVATHTTNSQWWWVRAGAGTPSISATSSDLEKYQASRR